MTPNNSSLALSRSSLHHSIITMWYIYSGRSCHTHTYPKFSTSTDHMKNACTSWSLSCVCLRKADKERVLEAASWKRDVLAKDLTTAKRWKENTSVKHARPENYNSHNASQDCATGTQQWDWNTNALTTPLLYPCGLQQISSPLSLSTGHNLPGIVSQFATQEM